MFETLADRFDAIFRRLRSRGRLSEADVDEVAREIRLALLEADVNVRVVKAFVNRLKARATGAEVAESLSPAQQVIKIVHEELTATLGGAAGTLHPAKRPPAVIVLVGLQGSGKTTAAAKLARHLEHNGRPAFLVAADLQRPAAIEQLRVLGEHAGVPVWTGGADPVTAATDGIHEAERLGKQVVIIDTAGRLQVDADLMAELAHLVDAIHPSDVLLTVDAMIGQDAVRVATEFADQVPLTGVVLTKLDGDARGGAALSVKEVTGLPILFAGIGEKLDDFEPFYPDRLASRILGMGDVLTLIEKAEAAFDADQAKAAEEKLRSGRFTLEDFLDQMRQMKKMGPLQGLVGMLPGVPKELRDAELDEGELGRVEAIICSMTPAERREPSLINGSRRHRIAQGSGTSTQQVNALLKQFKVVQQMMRTMTKGSKKGRRRLPVPGLPGLPGR
jgi:signal recognition particle subunit SRP54